MLRVLEDDLLGVEDGVAVAFVGVLVVDVHFPQVEVRVVLLVGEDAERGHLEALDLGVVVEVGSLVALDFLIDQYDY